LLLSVSRQWRQVGSVEELTAQANKRCKHNDTAIVTAILALTGCVASERMTHGFGNEDAWPRAGFCLQLLPSPLLSQASWWRWLRCQKLLRLCFPPSALIGQPSTHAYMWGVCWLRALPSSWSWLPPIARCGSSEIMAFGLVNLPAKVYACALCIENAFLHVVSSHEWLATTQTLQTFGNHKSVCRMEEVKPS